METEIQVMNFGDEQTNKDDVNFMEEQLLQAYDTCTSTSECLYRIAEGYSRNHGTCISWETDVNLNPPISWNKEKPEGDKYLDDYWNSLQYTLYETGHPETIDRTSQPRSVQSNTRVNVVLLSSPVECMGILLEGGKQVPDGFHLVMSPSWLSKTPVNNKSNLCKLWLHKSVSFHAGGTTFIDEYSPPRLVTYLVNYFTDNVTSGQRNDGGDIEADIDCPMSSSTNLCEMVDDKVWTRDIMSAVGMATPITLACRKNPTRVIEGHGDMKCIDFISYESNNRMEVAEEIAKFCDKLRNVNIRKVVVKPSGPPYLGSVGVSIHDISNFKSVLEAADALLIDIDDGCSVLIEEFIEPITPLKTGTDDRAPAWAADNDLAFRVRATVCRDYDNVPVTTLINCNMGYKDSPVNGDNSVGQTLATTLQAYNINDPDTISVLESNIRVLCARVMKGIIDRENLLSAEEKGAHMGQTDVIGIDIVITERSGKYIPVGIEVNGHDCTINTQLFDFMANLYQNASGHRSSPSKRNHHERHDIDVTKIDQTLGNISIIPQSMSSGLDSSDGSMCGGHERKVNIDERERTVQELRYNSGAGVGETVRPLIRNMIKRSQYYIMQEKRILVVGAGGVSKMKIWPDAREYGIKVILVDSDPNHIAKDMVYRMIHCKFDDHKKDFIHARHICNQLQIMNEKVDGCVTFWEDCVPLAALISEMLDTKGAKVKASLNAKKKSRTQNVLQTRTGDIPHWPRTFLYSSPSFHLRTHADIETAYERMTFPAFLKLEHGSSAVGGTIVNDKKDLIEKFNNISNKLTSEKDFPGIGLGHDNSMVLMDIYGGSEHDIDVIIYDRKLVGAFISDNGPTNYPQFIETAATMPSTLPEDKQAQLVTAAYQCCTEIGLSNGTYNVEMKMTKTGPKLIEINARMGGFYLREWIKRLYGVDLMLCAMMISAGIKPYIPKHQPDGHLMGIMLVPSHHNHVFGEKYYSDLKEMRDDDEIIFHQLSESEEVLADQYEEPFANITIKGTSVDEAKNKLKRVCERLSISNDSYRLDEFIKHFNTI
ncbi:Carnosine synthase 1 [Mactra antiquata]